MALRRAVRRELAAAAPALSEPGGSVAVVTNGGGAVAAASPLPRRLVTAAALLLMVLLIPVGAAFALGGGDAARGAGLGAVFGLLLAVKAGWWRALQVVPALVVSTAAGALTAGTGWWVVLLAAIGFIAGAASRFGLLAPVALVGMVAASTRPIPAEDSLAQQVVFAAVAAVYTVALTRWLRMPVVVPGVRVRPQVATAAAVLLAAVVAVAAALAQRSGQDLAYWLPVTVFVMVIPTPGLRFSQQARQRVLGTAAGVTAAVLLAFVHLPSLLRMGLALPTLLLTLAMPQPLWLSAGLVTLTLVLLLDPSGAGLAAGETRLAATASGAVLVCAGAGVLSWWGARHPASLAEADLAADLVRAQEAT